MRRSVLLTIFATLFLGLSRGWTQNNEASSGKGTHREAGGAQSSMAKETKLHDKFHRLVFPLLTHPDRGCVECHRSEGTSNLVLSGESIQDFRLLMDESYFRLKGVDTLLSRVTTPHADRRMPKDAEPWTTREVSRLRRFLDTIQEFEKQRGVASDEQFPRSLLSPYKGNAPALSEPPFLSYRQLKGKIQVLFDDDWKRGDRDFFQENLAMFGGADFKTRFDESTQPNPSFLTALELLARDVANRAYEQRSGPFTGWPKLSQFTGATSLESEGALREEYRGAVGLLYERILYRPPTEQEYEAACELIASVYQLKDSIQTRDDELAFEVTVIDPTTQLEMVETLRFPVNGELNEVRQIFVDQTLSNSMRTDSGVEIAGPKAEKNFEDSKSCSRCLLSEKEYLEKERVDQRLVLHNLGTYRNVSFAGVEILDLDGTLVEAIGIDSPKVELEGAWQIEESSGYRSFEDRNQHKGASTIRVKLDVPSSKEYRLALLYRSSERNDSQVLVELYSPRAGNRLASPPLPAIPKQGEAYFAYDSSNDTEPFFRPKASFQFADEGEVQINNRGTIDPVTAGAVEFLDRLEPDRAFLIDSKEAEGNERWKRFDEGRFKAYNVKGVKLHDDNRDKGELSLTYRPRSKVDQGWHSDSFYDLRVYFPGKKEQECRVPLVVRAKQSSPIIQVVHPRLAKAEALMQIDASSSYTVAHSSLRFRWKQISGTRVEMGDPNHPRIEFVVPRRSVDQAAWTALCAALLRHPDFLFTRPPSLLSDVRPEIKQRLRLVKLALDLVGRSPTNEEVDRLRRGVSLTEMADHYLASDEFRDFYFHRIRLYLESQGTVLQDEPARLWTYVALNGRPFREILTADYTVDENGAHVERPAEHGKTGLLTMKGFIQGKPGLPHYNYAAQVSMLFLGFVYEVPAEIVDLRVGVTALGTTDPNSVCYSCHKMLTPLAFQRLNWNDDGEFRLKEEDGRTIDASDQNAAEDYPFPGNGMEAFATQAVKKERFIRTMINTHINFYFGRPMRFREDERVLYKRLWDNVHSTNFQLKSLIKEIVTSPEYLLDDRLELAR